MLPGLIGLALINKGLIPALSVTEAGGVDAAQTYSHMITHLLPIGLRGLIAAALMAALMSAVLALVMIGLYVTFTFLIT